MRARKTPKIVKIQAITNILFLPILSEIVPNKKATNPAMIKYVPSVPVCKYFREQYILNSVTMLSIGEETLKPSSEPQAASSEQ